MKNLDWDQCVVCEKKVPDYEPVMCCNGYMCGCYGEPVEPCFCSTECESQMDDGMEYIEAALSGKVEVDDDDS